MYLTVTGNSTRPADTILKDATWVKLSPLNPSFIKTKLLPHIIESEINITQSQTTFAFTITRLKFLQSRKFELNSVEKKF